MWIFGGFLTGGGMAVLAWFVARPSIANLPVGTGGLAAAAVTAQGALLGFVAGAAVFRRARRDGRQLALFSALAGASAAGLLGAAYALTLTAAYVSAYATWPQDPLDQALLVLSYPVFAGVGAFVAGSAGLIIGYLLGWMIRPFAARAPRPAEYPS